MWYEVILDALKDTAILFPFLFLMYLLVEVVEHNTKVGKPNRALTGKCAPLIGAVSGLVPMCGFSVMAAKLYRHRHLTLGTLLAVLITTSDEAFLVLLTSPASGFGWGDMAISVLAMAGIKLFLGISVGYLADFLANKKSAPALQSLPECTEHAHGEEEEEGREEHGHGHGHEHAHGHEEFSACEHHREGKVILYLVSPLLHALKVAAFILLVNLAFGYLFFALGEDNVVAFLQAGYWYQPLVCCLIGLVPNCASSVILAETYAIGGIAFGSCLAGLVTNTGLGCLALLRGKAENKQALYIVLFLVGLGIAVGYAVNGIALCI